MGVAAYLETELDDLLIQYVVGVSQSATVFLVPIAVTMTAVYITWMGYSAARGDLQEPMSKIIKDLVTIVLVGMVALGFGQYQNLVIEGVNALMGDLIQLTGRGAARSVGQIIDSAFANCLVPPGETECVDPASAMLSLSIKHSTALGIPDFWYLITWLVLGISQVLLVVMTLLPFLLSKIALALILAVGPVFLLMLMFPITRQYFNSWLSAALGNVITLALVAAICTIVPLVFSKYAADMLNGIFEQGGQSLLARGMNILILAIGLGFTALKASQMGSQLAGGGVAMDGSGFVGQAVNAVTNVMGRRAQNQNNPTGRDDSASPNATPNSAANSESAGRSGGAPNGGSSGPGAGASRTTKASYYSGRVASDIVKALGRKNS